MIVNIHLQLAIILIKAMQNTGSWRFIEEKGDPLHTKVGRVNVTKVDF